MKIKKIIIVHILVLFLLFMYGNIVKAISPLSEPQYEGIDVSNWQGYIDYAQVKEAGIQVIYIKASQGSRYKDAYFDINYENAKSNGLKVGFYHFLTATTIEEAENEARFFSYVISGKVPDCKLVLDYEVFGGVGATEVNQIARVFLETTKRLTNKEVMLYSDLYNSNTVFSSDLANDYPLWIADYTNITNLQNARSNWQNWIGWQYTSSGRIVGINGEVDRDIYTKEIFLNEANEIPEVINPEEGNQPNTQTVYYTVKSGDTLGKIAQIYGTTVSDIANINGITNPNLIYPGQVLRILQNSKIYGNEERGTGSIVYTVKVGDTLSEIALSYGVTISSIEQSNDIQNPNLIFPGQQLRIVDSTSTQLYERGNPNEDITYVVRSDDTLWRIANRFGVSVSYLVNKNGISNPNLIFIGEIIRI